MKNACLPIALLRGCLTVMSALLPVAAAAQVDWALEKMIAVEARVLDVANSQNGKLLFVLVPGEVIVYTIPDGRETGRIPVDASFERISHSQKDNLLFLTGSASKKVEVVKVNRVQTIDLSGLPFKGPADARVTIAVFDDYQ